MSSLLRPADHGDATALSLQRQRSRDSLRHTLCSLFESLGTSWAASFSSCAVQREMTGAGAWTAQRREAESETHLCGAERGHAGDERERGTREEARLVIIADSNGRDCTTEVQSIDGLGRSSSRGRDDLRRLDIAADHAQAQRRARRRMPELDGQRRRRMLGWPRGHRTSDGMLWIRRTVLPQRRRRHVRVQARPMRVNAGVVGARVGVPMLERDVGLVAPWQCGRRRAGEHRAEVRMRRLLLGCERAEVQVRVGVRRR